MTSRTSLALWGALLLPALATAPTARGQAAPRGATRVHLQWNRPAGSTCIGQAELQKQVEAQLDRSVFVAEEAAPLRIAGDVQQPDGSWVATLRVEQAGARGQGVRQLRQEGGDCSGLSPALIVVLATLIGLAPSDSTEQNAVVVGAAGVIGFNVLPQTSAGASLWLGVPLTADWSLWLDATGWFPVKRVDALERGGTFNAWQAGPSLCRAFRAGERLAFAGCAGGQLGLVHGEGRGLGPNRSSERLLAQSGLEAAISLRLFSVIALRTSAGGALALTRPTFFVEQPNGTRQDVFRSRPFVFSLRAGLTFELR